MPYPNFHAARIRAPGLFARIVVLKTLSNGIMLYGGPLKTNPSGGAKTQAVRFPKNKFTVVKAKKWLKDHGYKPISFEKASATTTSSKQLELIIRNITPMVRNDEMEGRPYLVVPMIMITEGVHEGSDGPLLYPADELAKLPEVWNHKPVVVYHPSANGVGISACTPDVLTNRKIGVIMNTTFEDGKLKAEAWVEVERIKKVDERVLNAIEAGTIMELSTGVFVDSDETEGEWNGEHFVATASNYRPDHLALLPDLVGACSVADGAGFLRLNTEGEERGADGMIPMLWADDYFPFMEAAGIDVKRLASNAMGHGSIRSLLQSQLRDKIEDAWIEEVYDDFFIYENDGKLWKQTYEESEGEVNFKGEPIQVVRIIEYRTQSGAFIANRKDISMNDKKKLIDALIANKLTVWKEADRPFLMTHDEELLGKMAPVSNEGKGDDEGGEQAAAAADNKTGDDQDKGEDSGDDKGGDDKDKEGEPTGNKKTAEEYVKNAPPEIREVLEEGLVAHRVQKARLIKIITANEHSSFSEEQLKTKGLDELRMLAKLATKSGQGQPQGGGEPDYSGQGDPLTENEEEPLVAPVMNFDGAEEK